MSKLYHELAHVYHEMYLHLFNYKKEYEFHRDIFVRNKCSSILEIGCGTGNLSRLFVNAGYKYVGTDISEEMLAIARKNNPGITYIQKDMRDLDFNADFDAAFISGRGFSYMLKNSDVCCCLESIYKSLKYDGVFVFDNFDAESIFADFKPYTESQSVHGSHKYTRTSTNSMNLETGWTWNWNASYIIEEPGKEKVVIEDNSILRAFTKDELSIFLKINGFKLIDTLKYEFWFRTIARKNRG